MKSWVVLLTSCLFWLPAFEALERRPHPCPLTLRSDGHRPGHLEQLGCQRSPVGQVKEYFDIPTPRELWENHVKPYKPAVLRNALEDSPALRLWSDEYLTDVYGHQDVLIEKKYEDRKSEPKRMEIKEFLANYRKQNWYVVSMLPNAMRKDIKVPKPLVCSSFRKNLAELNLWIGTNGTRSMLHYDADNIMHCVVSGLKDWILIHPDNKPKCDMVLNRQGQNSGFSHLDVDRIDEDIHPEVWDIPWEYVTLRSGDCLYLPYQYLHQVRSYDRTISSTFLFYPNAKFSDDDCEGVDFDKYLSLQNVYVYWSHENGQETVDMGYMNPETVRQEVVEMMKFAGKDQMDIHLFLYLAYAHLGESIMEVGQKIVLTFFENVDTNGDGIISIQEMENADTEVIKQYCRGVENPHGPTKSSLSSNERFSSKTPDFAPRRSDRHVDSRYASIFLKFALRVLGKNGQITYPEFKKVVEVKDGSITDAFILFDKDYDGVLTTKEINNATQKTFRQFSRMHYGIKGTAVQGGGEYAEEVEGRDMSYLSYLDNLPDKENLQEEEDGDESEEMGKIQTELKNFFVELKEIMQSDGTIDMATFNEAAKSFGSEDGENFDSKIFFSFLDRGDKGHISSTDVEFYLSNERITPDEKVGRNTDLPKPLDFLSQAVMSMEHVMHFERSINDFRNRQKKDVYAQKLKTTLDRSEL